MKIAREIVPYLKLKIKKWRKEKDKIESISDIKIATIKCISWIFIKC